jgi:hypothetical protein
VGRGIGGRGAAFEQCLSFMIDIDICGVNNLSSFFHGTSFQQHYQSLKRQL